MKHINFLPLIILFFNLTTFANEVKVDFGWLTVEKFQLLTPNEQKAVISITRDTVALGYHTYGHHALEVCMTKLTSIELESIINTINQIPKEDKRFTNLVVYSLVGLQTGLCYETVYPTKPEQPPEKI